MNSIGINYLKLLDNCLNPVDLNVEEKFNKLQVEVANFRKITVEIERTLLELDSLADQLGVAEISPVEGDDIYKLIESHNNIVRSIFFELEKPKPNIDIFMEINSNNKELIVADNLLIAKKIKKISHNHKFFTEEVPLKIAEYKKNLEYCEIDYENSCAKNLYDLITIQKTSLKNIIEGAPYDFFDELFGDSSEKKINSLVIACEKEFSQTYTERVKQLAEIERLEQIELKRLEAERERIELEKKRAEEARLKKEREEQARLKAERERIELEKKKVEEARLKKEREEQARLQAEYDAKELIKKKIKDEQLRQEKAAKEEVQKRELAERLRIEQEELLKLQAERAKLKIVEDRLQKEKEELFKIQADREAKELQQKREKEKQERQLKEEELKKYREEAARRKAEQKALEAAQREAEEEQLRIQKAEKARLKKEEKERLDEELRKQESRKGWIKFLLSFLVTFSAGYFLVNLIEGDSTKKNSSSPSKYFTAAYFDRTRNYWGIYVGTTNQFESNNVALKSCISNSQSNSCEKIVIPDFRCLAVAYSKNKMATAVGSGDNLTIAGNAAVTSCNQGMTDANCSVSKITFCAP